MKAYPYKRNQEHKKEQEEHNQICIDHEVGSHKTMNGDTVRWQIWSKQNPNHNMVAATDKLEVGACVTTGRTP
jgi:phosphoribosylanthranilate isomerase